MDTRVVFRRQFLAISERLRTSAGEKRKGKEGKERRGESKKRQTFERFC
jgi:hypothetical protein